MLRLAIEGAGGIVIAVIGWEWSGYGPDWLLKLAEVGELARRLDAIVVAATPDRFIRNPFFKSNDDVRRHLQASEEDLTALRRAIGDDVRLMTYIDPNATPEKCGSLLTRWGQEVKGHPGGRPAKPDHQSGYRGRRMKKLLPLVLTLRSKGMTCRAIAAAIINNWNPPISHVTVCAWIKKYPNGC